LIVQEVKKRSGNEGFNVATGKYEDLVMAGVVDPTKVVRAAWAGWITKLHHSKLNSKPLSRFSGQEFK
jgi:hypothetical protein